MPRMGRRPLPEDQNSAGDRKTVPVAADRLKLATSVWASDEESLVSPSLSKERRRLTAPPVETCADCLSGFAPMTANTQGKEADAEERK
jgi:hypothetical protein